MLVTHSFGESNVWIVPDSEWRVQYYIAYNENTYATYVDFETSTWKEGLWENGNGEISETTWNFAAAGWVPAPVRDVYTIPNLY